MSPIERSFSWTLYRRDIDFDTGCGWTLLGRCVEDVEIVGCELLAAADVAAADKCDRGGIGGGGRTLLGRCVEDVETVCCEWLAAATAAACAAIDEYDGGGTCGCGWLFGYIGGAHITIIIRK